MTITSFTLVTKGPALGVRHLQVVFLFTCATLVLLQRMNMSVAIVAITNANSSNPDFPEYQLTGQQKSYVLSSTFWGSCFTQLLGGYLSSRFGAKLLLSVISLATGLLSVVTPFSLAWGGWKQLFGVRLLQGLVIGGMWPCLYTHLAKWCPKREQNRFGGIMTTGLDCGTALGFALSGVLAASPLGWPSAFYVPGYMGIVWCLLWLRYGANSPSESPFISLAERKYIELALEQSQAPKGETPPVPWRHILTSRPFLSLAFCKMSQACSFYTLMQQVPRYIHGIFRYNIWINALLSALPFVIMLMSSYCFIFLAEYLTRRRNIPLPILRKTINSYATWTPAIALVTLTYVSDKNVVGSICCLIAAVAAIAGQAIGSSLNHVDLAPNFAGLLFGISNTLMSIAGVISPLIIGYAVSNESDRTQWRSVFLGIAAILFVGNLLYLIFGRMTVQPWNGPKPAETGAAVETEKAAVPVEPISTEKFSYF